MRSLVSAELLKLRATRTAWIPLAAALALAVIAVLAGAGAALTVRREIGTTAG